MHALISIIKPIATWKTLKTTLEARIACGELGYSAYSRLGEIHSDCHVNGTWEGDNTVLLQQTAKFLLKEMGNLAKGKEVKYQTLYYLTIDDLSQEKLQATSVACFKNLDTIQALMEYLARKSIQEGGFAMQLNMATNDPYDSWNSSLPFDLNNASKLYGELYCHNTARTEIANCSVAANREFLNKMLVIKGLTIALEYSVYLLDFITS